jgi:hypothetical protein
VTITPTIVLAADELGEAKLDIIKTNCVAAQSTIQRIGRNDTISRINRGRDYDAVLKLFYAMNSRAASNNITEPRLAEITKSFEDELRIFRNKFNGYSGNYKLTVDIDCASRPADFYSRLNTTRSDRQAINSSIVKLDELISSYRAAITEMKL